MVRAEQWKWGDWSKLPDAYFVLMISKKTRYDEILKAIDDGRPDRIIDEHTRYMKETDREIWAT